MKFTLKEISILTSHLSETAAIGFLFMILNKEWKEQENATF